MEVYFTNGLDKSCHLFYETTALLVPCMERGNSLHRRRSRERKGLHVLENLFVASTVDLACLLACLLAYETVASIP